MTICQIDIFRLLDYTHRLANSEPLIKGKFTFSVSLYKINIKLMPVTKTAKRALRSSQKKLKVNKTLISRLEIAMRGAKKSKSEKDIKKATSLADRASKKKIIHSNKAGRIKKMLSSLSKKTKTKVSVKK